MYAVTTKGAAKAEGVSSQGASSARFVFVSAQEPLDPVTGHEIKGSITLKAARSLLSVSEVLQEAELGLQDIVKMVVYLTNMDDLKAVDAVLGEHIQQPFPARTVIEVASLPKGSALAIEAIACK